MHIKSIEINGFKSYGTKVEINGFDPFFNAITGLNGSGKSNILDAICFVLGITNLQHVRANSLQELVYKAGQAGVTKAVVTITFDNSDTANSPLGYEQHREITVTRIVIVGGRNKYLINGVAANNHRLQDFFQSVQLNVNNPHFLIMQGRITKVLNMKPKEILSMVEEAAGTRMYEMKKENSLKIMMKKEDRLMEIDKVIEEEITPTLTKLKEERRDYVEYTKICRELDHLTKLHVAWQYLQAQEMSSKSNEGVEKIHEEIKLTEAKIQEMKAQLADVEAKMKELEQKRDEETGSKLQELEANLKKKTLEETKKINALQNMKSNLKDLGKKKKDLLKNQKDETHALANKEKDILNQEKKIEKLKQVSEEDATAAKAAEKYLHDVNAGMVQDADGKAATIASQLMAAEGDIKKAETEEKMASMNLTKMKEELAKKQAAYTEMDDAYKAGQTSYKALEKQIARLKQEIDGLGYDEQKAQKVRADKDRLDNEIHMLRDELDRMKSRFPHLLFDYVDPVKNFDRRKVFGKVCSLLKVKDPAATLALELAAGGKLMNVVVDNDSTGKLLLEKGQLRQRVTIIPLNKIKSHIIEKSVADYAERLVGKDNASPALSLITYNKAVESAMQHVFGNVFICRNMESAKRVAFADGIKKRCVTLEGEVFDPSGTLSGGSTSQRPRHLAELAKISDLEQKYNAARANLNNLTKELQRYNALAERYQSLQSSYEVKVSELETIKLRIEQSNYHQQQQEIENLKESIQEKQNIIAQCKQLKKKAEERYKELKRTDTKSAREQELKNAEKALTVAQKKAAESEKCFKDGEQELEQFKLEAEDLKKNLVSYEQQLSDLANNTLEQEKKIEEAGEELTQWKDVIAAAAEEVKAQKALLKSHSTEISKMQKTKEGLTRDIGNAQLSVQQLEHDVAKCKEDAKSAQKSVEHFVNAYPWIEEDKKYFGVPNTEFDFTNYDARGASSRLNKLQEAKGRLSKSVNTRAQNMLSAAEEQYKDLIAKKNIVLNDREQIQNVIKELDDQKRIALRTACEKVNEDFGSIFSTLLPGAKAKLNPQEEGDSIEGLEFKVGFGDVWKESLMELSGGQRSLVALSLILSLLLFKPAPIYILDEVDAALDLSHTQNIGEMLKKHFRSSQFIVVSLKEGMFTNANVLFRTKFVDGMSTVTRVTGGRN